jgi:integrase
MAVSRLLGHSDKATTLRYYVHDAFSDEEALFGGLENLTMTRYAPQRTRIDSSGKLMGLLYLTY